MLEFQQGSREAFAELFARYRQPIYGFFRRRLNHAARAEELAQETFMAVLRATARYEPRALFRTYLYGVALNLLAAERRKSGREVSDAEEVARAADPAGGNDPDAALWVRHAIDQLDAEQREILLLREYEQLSYEENCCRASDPGEFRALAVVPRTHGPERLPGAAERDASAKPVLRERR